MTQSKATTAMEPRDLSHHFSKASRKRKANIMKEYYRFLRIPGMGSFAGGSPYPGYFPFNDFEISLVAPQTLATASPNGLNPEASNATPYHKLRLIREAKTNHWSRQIDLDTALQYGISQGYPALYAWLKKLTSTVYHPDIPYKGGADVIVSGGAADGLAKVYEVFFNAWDEDFHKVEDREGLLVEEFVYPPAVVQVRHKDVNIVPVKMDDEGMIAYGKGGLLEVLETWDLSKGRRPHMLYTVPTGQNPTSIAMSIIRRKEVYHVCSRYDVLIVEDDPYWTLQYPAAQSASNGNSATHQIGSINGKDNSDFSEHRSKNTGYKFVDELIPSFLSIDKDGRVIRLDTFSKTIAPGCRLGWVTAQPAICEQIFRVTDATTQQPSGFVQAVVAKMLSGLDASTNPESSDGGLTQPSTIWGLDGWIGWLEALRNKYRHRMETMATFFHENRFKERESGNIEMFNFSWPKAGMFIWVKVNISSHPLASIVNPKRLMLGLWILCTQEPYQIIMNPGADFAANENIRDEYGYLYLRFCFAAVDERILRLKSKAFTDACKHFWELNRAEDINQILQNEDELNSATGTNQTADDNERLTLEDW